MTAVSSDNRMDNRMKVIQFVLFQALRRNLERNSPPHGAVGMILSVRDCPTEVTNRLTVSILFLLNVYSLPLGLKRRDRPAERRRLSVRQDIPNRISNRKNVLLSGGRPISLQLQSRRLEVSLAMLLTTGSSLVKISGNLMPLEGLGYIL